MPIQPKQPDIQTYRAPAIALHWLIAALIFGGFGLGVFMHDLPLSADKLRYFSWHKWIGVTVFLLALLRVLWRATHKPPALPPAPRWEHWVANGTHGLLYILMFAIPLSGWTHSSASGYQTVYLGLIPLPDLLGKNEALAELLGEAHELLNFTLLGLLVLHAGAALQHHFLRRDEILRRMLPTRGASAWALLVALAAVLAFGSVGALLLSESEEAGHEHQHEHEHAAEAGENTANPALSATELSAEFRQMNVPVSGQFKAVRAEELQFDPQQLDQARAIIVVDTGSFDIGDEDYNAEVRKPEWLDATAHPQARFVARQVVRKGDGYEATGEFTFKGQTRSLTVPFTVTTGSGHDTYAGSFNLSRKDFSIGDADWNDVLDDKVIVSFKLSQPVSIDRD